MSNLQLIEFVLWRWGIVHKIFNELLFLHQSLTEVIKALRGRYQTFHYVNEAPYLNKQPMGFISIPLLKRDKNTALKLHLINAAHEPFGNWKGKIKEKREFMCWVVIIMSGDKKIEFHVLPFHHLVLTSALGKIHVYPGEIIRFCSALPIQHYFHEVTKSNNLISSSM